MKKYKAVKFVVISLLTLIVVNTIYAFKVEPYSINIEWNLIKPEGEITETLKVVHFSDTHLKEDFNKVPLDNIVHKINNQQADIVVFTGDLYDNYAKYNSDDMIISYLKQIKSKYGNFAVWGNHDYGGGSSRHYEYVMTEAGFRLLRNEEVMIKTESNKSILIYGLDDSMLGKPHTKSLTRTVEANFIIMLSHEPDTVDRFINEDFNLFLSGHSHGGQINIPWIPALNKFAVNQTNLAEKYTNGSYDLTNSKSIFVNVGIGTSHVPMRFGVHPKITVHKIFLK